MSPTDYQYWREMGWLDKDAVHFHDNIQPSPVMDQAARVVGWMTGRQIDKVLEEPT
jgi:hypothetical protein